MNKTIAKLHWIALMPIFTLALFPKPTLAQEVYPAKVKATPLSSTQIQLSWFVPYTDDTTPAPKFVEIRTARGTIARVPLSIKGFMLDGLQPNTDYSVAVCTVYYSQSSASSRKDFCKTVLVTTLEKTSPQLLQLQQQLEQQRQQLESQRQLIESQRQQIQQLLEELQKRNCSPTPAGQ